MNSNDKQLKMLKQKRNQYENDDVVYVGKQEKNKY